MAEKGNQDWKGYVGKQYPRFFVTGHSLLASAMRCYEKVSHRVLAREARTLRYTRGRWRLLPSPFDPDAGASTVVV
jgi:hypothetical protein